MDQYPVDEADPFKFFDNGWMDDSKERLRALYCPTYIPPSCFKMSTAKESTNYEVMYPFPDQLSQPDIKEDVPPPPPPSAERYDCSCCAMSYSHRSDLIQHQKKCHPELDRVPLDTCSKKVDLPSDGKKKAVSYSPVNLDEYQISEICHNSKTLSLGDANRLKLKSRKKKENLYFCDQCPGRFTSITLMNTHISKRHPKVPASDVPPKFLKPLSHQYPVDEADPFKFFGV